MRRAFQFFDRDRSGSISYAEFKLALREYTMLEFDAPTIEKLLHEFDDNNSGEVRGSKRVLQPYAVLT